MIDKHIEAFSPQHKSYKSEEAKKIRAMYEKIHSAFFLHHQH